MLQSKARNAVSGAHRHEHRHHGRPARILAPVPAQGARWAQPGERPPSLLAPGQPDQVIDRFDAYAKQWRAGKVKRNAR